MPPKTSPQATQRAANSAAMKGAASATMPPMISKIPAAIAPPRTDRAPSATAALGPPMGHLLVRNALREPILREVEGHFGAGRNRPQGAPGLQAARMYGTHLGS